jgi:glycerol dehydrogenase
MQTITFTGYTIGEDAYKAISSICSLYGDKIQIIGGYKALEVAMPELKACLKGSDIQLLDPLFYGGECTYENMKALAAKSRENGADIIAGVGGGKAIDTAKGVASMLNLPVVTIPTIAATCAATTKLSVVYDSNHKFVEFMFYDNPPIHTFINSSIIAKAPTNYLRAGMGDTLAKHYECTFAARNDNLNFTSALGRTISHMCAEPLFIHGTKALQDCEETKVTTSLEQVIQANIVNTGMVSLLVDEEYNGAVAHSLFYGLTLLPHIEEKYLHGDVVAYGILVQLMIDEQINEAKKIYTYLKEWGCPVSLADIEVSIDRQGLSHILSETINGPDMEHLPYKINDDMVYEGILLVESLNDSIQ